MNSSEIKELFNINRQLLHIWNHPEKFNTNNTRKKRKKIYNILKILKKDKILEILNRNKELRDPEEIYKMFGFDNTNASFEKFVSTHSKRIRLLELLQKINDKELETVEYFS